MSPDDSDTFNDSEGTTDASEATTPAAVTFRNAAANPASYSASAPVIGGQWNASVDLSLTGHSLAQVSAYSAPAMSTLAGGQELLIGGLRRFVLPAKTGPLASWSSMIPNSVALAGVTVYTQAVHLLGVTPYALSNAQDLTVGYY